MFVIKVDKEKFKACCLCINVCPKNIFLPSTEFNKMGYHYIQIDKKNICNGCKRCVLICPDVAIEIYKDKEDKL